MKLMKLTELPQVMSAVLSNGPFGDVDVCLGLEIPDQPDEVPVAILVYEFCPYVGEVDLGRQVLNVSLAFRHHLANVILS